MPTKREFWRSRWWLPGVSLLLGVAILVAFVIGGDVQTGVISLGVMLAVGALFLFGSRSETLRGLGGPGRDERWARIDVHATAITGMVTIAIILGAWLVEVARGDDGSPFVQLGAVSGLVYVVSVAVLRWRS